ncbi:tail fiber domain-containing protein [Phaeobacter sp. J2-8]|uniref:tail fiber domain-containing protein n=1 Tax=Phaeobacter sp. J2-8 TaxID=2931394 RepID=UPI001FD031AF|nr:tail fiber domain-containing protein [Phaeobacter sp. J2-8]MCJ7874798.1 tail fiber domain-containing protein [Phaeobacter sp. J2-8]
MLLVPGENTSLAVFDLSNTGDLQIDGALTQSSDKNRKMAIEPVDPTEILAKVRSMPVAEWTYKHDAATGIRHIGPMAQDFYAAFGTGADEKGISSLDGTGVALAAIQALSAENIELRARLDTLEAQQVRVD